MTESSLICFLNCSANMSTTSRIMVSSISYYHSYGTSLSATRCCFTSWISNASSHGPYTGMKTFSISFNKMGWLHGSLLFFWFPLDLFLLVFFFLIVILCIYSLFIIANSIIWLLPKFTELFVVTDAAQRLLLWCFFIRKPNKSTLVTKES